MIDNEAKAPVYFKLGRETILLLFDFGQVEVPASEAAMEAFFNDDWEWFRVQSQESNVA